MVIPIHCQWLPNRKSLKGSHPGCIVIVIVIVTQQM
jgi:hypothetical protein